MLSQPKQINIWYKNIILWSKMVNERFNILKLLIENPEKNYSINKIAKERNVNYKTAYQATHQLQEKN